MTEEVRGFEDFIARPVEELLDSLMNSARKEQRVSLVRNRETV
jgi:hypothetical protein